MRLTIPHEWKDILKGNVPEIVTDVLQFNKLKNYKTLKSKDLYWLILYKKHDCVTYSNAHKYWTSKYNISDENMEKIYTLSNWVTKRTNLQSLQYKITNKIINCNYWLHKIKITDSAKCRFCNNAETIEHYFYGCMVTKQFWKAFLGWWNTVRMDKIPLLQEYDIVLGYIKNDLEGQPYKILNCCILVGKEMIYHQKSNNQQPDLYKFHCYLKDYILIEKTIAANNTKLDKLIDEWRDILEICE